MAVYIQKLTKANGQYRLSLPRTLLESAGLDKTRVLELWVTKKSIINIREYHGRKETERTVSRS